MLISDFSKQYNNYHITSNVGNIEIVKNKIKEKQVDLGIMVSDIPFDNWPNKIKFHEDNLCLSATGIIVSLRKLL